MANIRLVDVQGNPVENATNLHYVVYDILDLGDVTEGDILASGDDGTTDSSGFFTLPEVESTNDGVFLVISDSDGSSGSPYNGFAGTVFDEDHVVIEEMFVYSGSLDNTVRKLDSNGIQIWSTGTSIADNAYAVAVDPGGFVYAGTRDDNALIKLDSSGNEIWRFTGHDDLVLGVAVDSNGFVYSAGQNDNTMRKIDSNGNEVWTFLSGDRVRDVAVDANGFSYNTGNNGTFKVDSNGNEVWHVTDPLSTGTVAVDADGFVYIGTIGINEFVRKLNSDGNEVWTFNYGDTVRSVDVDQNGFVYASGDNTVKKIDSDGNEVWTFTGHTGIVVTVSVDSDGFVYSGSGDESLKKLDQDGNEVWTFTGHTNIVYGVAVDPGKYGAFPNEWS